MGDLFCDIKKEGSMCGSCLKDLFSSYVCSLLVCITSRSVIFSMRKRIYFISAHAKRCMYIRIIL
jgi:hypothetical protein